MAPPMPSPPPVTTATLPSRSRFQSSTGRTSDGCCVMPQRKPLGQEAAPVDHQGRPGHVRGGVADDELHGPGDVVGRAEAAEGQTGQVGVLLLLAASVN